MNTWTATNTTFTSFVHEDYVFVIGLGEVREREREVYEKKALNHID
jgi:hypothetical protein